MSRSILAMLQRIRIRFCNHRWHLDDLKRADDEYVEAPCLRCGKLLRAPYGLVMPGKMETEKRRA